MQVRFKPGSYDHSKGINQVRYFLSFCRTCTYTLAMVRGEMLESERMEGLLHRLAMLRGWSSATRSSYHSDLLHASSFLAKQGTDLFAAGTEELMHYLSHLSRQGLKASTIQRRRSALSTWFGFLQDHGLREDHPIHDLPGIRSRRPLPKLISEHEMEMILGAPDTASPLGVRDRCALELLYACGMRISELLGLRLADIDRQAGLLRVTGKGNKERMVPFGEAAGVWLDRWLMLRPARTASPFVFPGRHGKAMSRQNFWKRIRMYAKDAGLRQIPSPHTLRHAFATHMLAHGADLRAVQMLLGHAHVTTTEIYTHVNKARLHQLVNQSHPLGQMG